MYFILNATVSSLDNETEYISDVTSELTAISQSTNFEQSTPLGRERHALLNKLHQDECIITDGRFVGLEELQESLRTRCGSIDSEGGVFIGRYRAYEVRPVDEYEAKINPFR